jgi:hypothetical protein
VAKKCREGVHVVPLERLNVPLQQRLLVVVERPRRRTVLPVGRQSCTRPLEGAVHGRNGGVEQLGGLVGMPAEDLAQDEDGALLRRKPLQCRDER